MKLTNMAGTTGFFATLGLSAGIAWAVALVETLGGLGLVFGAWAKLSALGSLIIMLGVFYYTKDFGVKPITIALGSIIVLIWGAGQYALCKGGSKSVATTQPTSTVPPSNSAQM